jgi:hypothetical protein
MLVRFVVAEDDGKVKDDAAVKADRGNGSASSKDPTSSEAALWSSGHEMSPTFALTKTVGSIPR